MPTPSPSGAGPLPARKLMVHEARLSTSMLRWLAFRRHGVRAGDIAVPYASGGAAVLFAFASAIETVVLAFIIPWPAVRDIALDSDIWGVLHHRVYASFVVRPHVIHADGSLRLRYGALLDIGIPARDIAAARVERRSARGKPGGRGRGRLRRAVPGWPDHGHRGAGAAGGIHPTARQACARTFRYYAADPAAAVAATRTRVPLLQSTPSR